MSTYQKLLPSGPASRFGDFALGRSIIMLTFLLGGLLFLAACDGRLRSNLEPLPVQSYLQKPGDFLGNRYLLRAQISEQIRWERGFGRVLAVSVDGIASRLPIFVPESVGQNLHVGQRYAMEVIIEEGGLIYVEALRKY